MKIDLKIQGFIHGNRILKKISKIIRWIEKKEPKLRVTFEAERYTYADEVELLAEVIDEIYESFLISAVLAGKVDIPDFWEQKAVYFRHTFEKPPKDWIDPVKEANAAKIAVQTGQKTFKQIAAQNGSDWRKQVDDICDVLDYAMEQHGIDLGGVILGQNTNRERGAEQSAAPDEK